MLEWLAIFFTRASSHPQGANSCLSCIGRWILYHHWATWEAPSVILVVLNSWLDNFNISTLLESDRLCLSKRFFFSLPFSIFCNFFLWYLGVVYWEKGTAIKKPLVIVWWDMGREVVYSPMIRSQCSSEPNSGFWTFRMSFVPLHSLTHT